MNKLKLIDFKDTPTQLVGMKVLVTHSTIGQSSRSIHTIQKATSTCITVLAGDTKVEVKYHLTGELFGTKSSKYHRERMNMGTSHTAELLLEDEANTLVTEWRLIRETKTHIAYINFWLPKVPHLVIKNIYNILKDIEPK
jgi:hypothetical protein